MIQDSVAKPSAKKESRAAVSQRRRPMHPPKGDEDEKMPENLWERMPGERTKPWDAFVKYRDAGIHRSLSQLARDMTGIDESHPRAGKVGRPRSMGRIMEWSKEYNWKARVAAFDRFIDEERVKKQVEDQRAMVERHITIGGIMQGQAIKRLRELTEDELRDLRPSDIVKFLVEGTKIERVARGMPSEYVKREGGIDEDTARELKNQMESSREQLMRKLDEISRKKSISVNAVPTGEVGRSDLAEAMSDLMIGKSAN